MKSETKGRDIFYGIVAVATLIVAIIGATLAYFSITTSSNQGAVNATAAIISISYNDGQQVTAQADQLIPASFEVVQKVYTDKVATLSTDSPNEANACIDKNDKQVCSVYRFTLESDVETEITAYLNNEHNGFSYLSYAVYDVTNKKWITLTDEGSLDLALEACTNKNDNLEDDCYTEEATRKTYSGSDPLAVNPIFGYTIKDGIAEAQSQLIASATQAYDLILFIKETGENQNADQGQNYSGTIVIEVVDGELSGSGHVTGEAD